jgi:hypothetical protein
MSKYVLMLDIQTEKLKLALMLLTIIIIMIIMLMRRPVLLQSPQWGSP